MSVLTLGIDEIESIANCSSKTNYPRAIRFYEGTIKPSRNVLLGGYSRNEK